MHGLFIYEREGNEVFFHMSANAKVTTDPSMFLNGMASSFDETPGLGEREQTALALIALSKIAREPLAEAALCISAVEYLSTAGHRRLGTLRTPRISAAQAIVDSAFPMSSSWCHRFDASIPAKLQEFLTMINFNDDDVHRTAPLSQTNYDPQRSRREGRAIP